MLIGTGKILARYPSGNRMELEGQLRTAVDDTSGILPIVFDAAKVATILDPRCVIELDGTFRYRPRKAFRQLAPWAKTWLKQNPEWDAG